MNGSDVMFIKIPLWALHVFFFFWGRRWWWNNSVEEDSLSPPALGCCGPFAFWWDTGSSPEPPPPLLLTFTRHLSDRLGVTHMIFSDGTVLYLNLNCFEMMEHMDLGWSPQWTAWGCCVYSLLRTEQHSLGSGSIWGLPWLHWIAFCSNTCLASRETRHPSNGELSAFLSRTLTKAPSCWLLLKVTYTT